jgi:hypothetical protein
VIVLSAGSWGRGADRCNSLESLLNRGAIAAERREAEMRRRVSPGRVDGRSVHMCREISEVVCLGAAVRRASSELAAPPG